MGFCGLVLPRTVEACVYPKKKRLFSQKRRRIIFCESHKELELILRYIDGARAYSEVHHKI